MKKIILISMAITLYTNVQGFGYESCKKEYKQNLSSTEIVKNEPKTITLKITGMTCAGCSKTIHSSLSKKDGILENEVKFPGDLAVIKYDPTKITEKEIITVVEKAGYKAELVKSDCKSSAKPCKSIGGGCCAPKN